MMLRREFVDLPEWQEMKQAIWDKMQTAISEAVNAPSMEVKEFYRGVAETLGEMIMLPALVLAEEPDSDEKLVVEKPDLGQIYVSNRKSLDQLY
jgi:hypothetical protein